MSIKINSFTSYSNNDDIDKNKKNNTVNDDELNESTRLERFRYDITENLKKITQAEILYNGSRQKMIELSDNLDKLKVKSDKIDSKLEPIILELINDVNEMVINSYDDIKDKLNSISNKLLNIKDINVENVQSKPDKTDNNKSESDVKIKSKP